MTSSAPPATDLVLAERRGPVLVLTLNRPERLNAWTDALEERYFAQLDAAENDPEVRAIVVTGAGRGAVLRRPLRRAGGEAHDSVRAPRADRGVRPLMDPAPAGRALLS
jgi:enoyl-CoA hydratase/carnithine racemase